MSALKSVVPTQGTAAPNEPRFSHRAVLLSAGIGFIIGVVITTAFLPVLTASRSSKHGNAAKPTPIPYSAAQVQQQVTSLTNTALGKYGGSGKSAGKNRLQKVAIHPVLPGRYPGRTNGLLFDVAIHFLVQPNPFTKLQVGGAQTDCFLVLQSLYAHDLPLENVDLYGGFQFPSGRRPATVLHAGSDQSIEYQLGPWGSLPRTDSSMVWSHLRPNWIATRFATFHGLA
jgi:hypothetical protein